MNQKRHLMMVISCSKTPLEAAACLKSGDACASVTSSSRASFFNTSWLSTSSSVNLTTPCGVSSIACNLLPSFSDAARRVFLSNQIC